MIKEKRSRELVKRICETSQVLKRIELNLSRLGRRGSHGCYIDAAESLKLDCENIGIEISRLPGFELRMRKCVSSREATLEILDCICRGFDSDKIGYIIGGLRIGLYRFSVKVDILASCMAIIAKDSKTQKKLTGRKGMESMTEFK